MMIGVVIPRSPTSSTICLRATPRSGVARRADDEVPVLRNVEEALPPVGDAVEPGRVLESLAGTRAGEGHGTVGSADRLGAGHQAESYSAVSAAVEPHVELGRGKGDAAGPQGVVDEAIDLASERSGAVEKTRGPAEQLEAQAPLAELFEPHPGRWVGQDVFRLPGRLEKGCLHFRDVAAGRDGDRNPVAHAGLPEAAVDDGVADELRVGHDQGDVVVGADDRRPRPDLRHVPDDLSDLDRVTDLDGPLDQDHEARDEVLHDVLEPEPEADPERPPEHGERRRVDPERLQRDEHPEEEDDVAEHTADRVPRPTASRVRPSRRFGDEVPDEAREKKAPAMIAAATRRLETVTCVSPTRKSRVDKKLPTPGVGAGSVPQLRALPSSSSAASVTVFTPVRIVGSRSGANPEEWREGSAGPPAFARLELLRLDGADPHEGRGHSGAPVLARSPRRP